MSDFIVLAIVLGIMYLAITRTFPDDSNLKKTALAVGTGVALLWERIWAIIQPLLQSTGAG